MTEVKGPVLCCSLGLQNTSKVQYLAVGAAGMFSIGLESVAAAHVYALVASKVF